MPCRPSLVNPAFIAGLDDDIAGLDDDEGPVLFAQGKENFLLFDGPRRAAKKSLLLYWPFGPDRFRCDAGPPHDTVAGKDVEHTTSPGGYLMVHMVHLSWRAPQHLRKDRAPFSLSTLSSEPFSLSTLSSEYASLWIARTASPAVNSTARITS
jgi:hypothetical protein